MLNLLITLAVLCAATEWLRRRSARDDVAIQRATEAERDAVATAVGALRRVPSQRQPGDQS